MGIPGTRLALWLTGQTFIGVYNCQRWTVGAAATDPFIGFSIARRGGDTRDQSSGAFSSYPTLDKTEPAANLGVDGVPRQSLKLRIHPLSVFPFFVILDSTLVF